MSALVECIISLRDDIKSGRGTITRVELDILADAANAITEAEKALKLAVDEIRTLRRIANRETHWIDQPEFVEGIAALAKMEAAK